MIRFSRLTSGLLDAWMVNQPVPVVHGRYRLRVWREDRSALSALQAELEAYLEEAFDDARKRIRRGFEDPLSPLDDLASDPAANFPRVLHRSTLQGYLGETLAAMAVEHWGAHGHQDWKIPALLFRFHDQEFQHLDRINERLLAGEDYAPDNSTDIRPGRTGDDCIAFRMNSALTITDMLTLEAKCLARHNATKIAQAHGKLANAGQKPAAIRELINLLEEYDTLEAAVWQEALLKLWQEGFRTAARYDAVGYACGQLPTPATRIGWMPADAPHAAYTGDRKLEGLEFQFADLPSLVDALFRRS
ncbi:MAG: hypothetical protein ABIV11_04185 [Gemmatimonadaceae bacterium]